MSKANTPTLIQFLKSTEKFAEWRLRKLNAEIDDLEGGNMIGDVPDSRLDYLYDEQFFFTRLKEWSRDQRKYFAPDAGRGAKRRS